LAHSQPSAIGIRRGSSARQHQCNDEAPHMPPIIMPRICIGSSSSQKPNP
jgi:hypothetical protein